MPLPAPPSDLPAKPGTAPIAEPVKTNQCQVCGQEAKYTCPRCEKRTCSVACSKSHKATDNCSGVRNPAAYVPLNKITQGTWDGDYTWLEQGRRQVAEWGEGITAEEAERAARGDSSKRGRGGARGGRNIRRSRLDGLRWATSEIGAEVDLVPDGMQRRKTNQSSWNAKNQSLHMTIQFSVSPTLAPDAEQQNITHPRVSVLPRSVPPATLNSLLPEDLLAKNPILALPYYYPRSRDTPDPTPPSRSAKYFPPLDGSKPIDQALNGTAYVEFPTIRVFDRTEWLGKLGNGEVSVVPRFETKVAESGPAAAQAKTVPAKRARPEGLGLGLGAYDSNSDEDDEGGEEEGEGEGEDGGDEVAGTEEARDDSTTQDITLSPRMAQAIGDALEADFGPMLGN